HSKSRSFAGRGVVASFSSLLVLVVFPAVAHANFSGFKSPGPGMHFTKGQPIVVYADLFDSRNAKGFIVCPTGQTISNTSPPPGYSDPDRQAQCSGGGTPTGWPQLQLLVDGALQTDIATNSQTVPNTTAFNHDLNPSPIAYFPFTVASAGLAPGVHQVVARARFSVDGVTVTTLDSAPMAIYVDAPPAKSTITLTSDVTGTVTWDNVIVVGNGHSVAPTGSLVIKNSLVTGVAGIAGTVNDADIEGSIFEDSGPVN